MKFYGATYHVIIHGKSADDYQHLGKYVSHFFSYNQVLRLLQLKISNPKLPFYVMPHLALNALQDCIANFTPEDVHDHFVDHMGGMQIETEYGRRQYFIWIWIRDLKNERKYKYLRESGVWREDPTKTLEQMQFDTKFQIDSISYDLLRYKNIIGIYSNTTSKQIYLVAHPNRDPNMKALYILSKYMSQTNSYISQVMSQIDNVLVSH